MASLVKGRGPINFAQPDSSGAIATVPPTPRTAVRGRWMEVGGALDPLLLPAKAYPTGFVIRERLSYQNLCQTFARVTGLKDLLDLHATSGCLFADDILKGNL